MTPRVCHLPRPISVTAIRLDRFSPNFNESNQLGFTRVRPLPFYEFIYDLPESARRNLAYFFAYDYKAPQDVARYAEPLLRSVHAWRTTWRHAELLSVDLEDQLVVFDTRPRAFAPVSVLRGDDRALYLACDAITDASQLEPPQVTRLEDDGRSRPDAVRRQPLSLSRRAGRRVPAVARRGSPHPTALRDGRRSRAPPRAKGISRQVVKQEDRWQRRRAAAKKKGATKKKASKKKAAKKKKKMACIFP